MRVVAEILTFRCPPVGIQRVTDRPSDPPGSQVVHACGEHEDAGLVESHDRVKPNLEGLLDILQVANDLLGCPTAGIGTHGQLLVRLARDRPLQLDRRLVETPEPRLYW